MEPIDHGGMGEAFFYWRPVCARTSGHIYCQGFRPLDDIPTTGPLIQFFGVGCLVALDLSFLDR